MKKMIFVILGLAFMVLGFLGLTGWVKMFQYYPIYLNIGEIVLGLIAFLYGVYARQIFMKSSKKAMPDQKENEINEQENKIVQQKKEIEKQRNEIDLQENVMDQQEKEIDKQRNEIDQQRKEIDQQKY